MEEGYFDPRLAGLDPLALRVAMALKKARTSSVLTLLIDLGEPPEQAAGLARDIRRQLEQLAIARINGPLEGPRTRMAWIPLEQAQIMKWYQVLEADEEIEASLPAIDKSSGQDSYIGLLAFDEQHHAPAEVADKLSSLEHRVGRTGTYSHNTKGGDYRVIGVAWRPQTDDLGVVYVRVGARAIYYRHEQNFAGCFQRLSI